MTFENEDFFALMRQVLWKSIDILYPLSRDPEEIIIPHIWRNRRYLGEIDGHIPTWRGWSANLGRRYGTLYIDVADNVLPNSERIRLFGDEFTKMIEGKNQFITLFALGFPREAELLIRQKGFVPRRLSVRRYHACVVADLNEFTSQNVLVWASLGVKLIRLQREFATQQRFSS